MSDFFMCAGEAYTIYNTLGYAVLFLVFLGGIARIARKVGLKVSGNFYLSVLPLLLAGPTVRVLLDSGFYRKVQFPGPCLALNTTLGISILLLSAGVLSLLAANILRERLGFYRAFGAVNLLFFFLYHAVYLASAGGVLFSVDLFAASRIASYGFAASLLFYVIAKRAWAFFLDARNFLLVSVHLFDASTTFVGLGSGYSEQQVLPSLLIGIFGPYAIFAVKLLIVPAVVYLLRKEKDRELLYFGVFLLGFAPASRNLLRIILGV